MSQLDSRPGWMLPDSIIYQNSCSILPGRIKRSGLCHLDLPMTEYIRDNAQLRRGIDLATNVEGLDKHHIEQLVNAERWQELPAPFSLKVQRDFNLITQFALLPQNKGRYILVKHMHSPEMKIMTELRQEMCLSSVFSENGA